MKTQTIKLSKFKLLALLRLAYIHGRNDMYQNEFNNWCMSKITTKPKGKKKHGKSKK